MTFEENVFSSEDKKQKQERIEAAIKAVNEMADSLGKGIDEGIKDAIVSLEIMDISTSASCEGHPRKGSKLVPWIKIGNIEEPDERFVNENKIFQKVAQDRNLSFEEVKRFQNPDTYWEVMREASENNETKEYQEWEKQNKEEFEKVGKLIEEFYKIKGEPANPDAKISQDPDFNIIYSGGKDYIILEEESSEEQKTIMTEKIKEYQAEFKRFADFLLEKYMQA